MRWCVLSAASRNPPPRGRRRSPLRALRRGRSPSMIARATRAMTSRPDPSTTRLLNRFFAGEEGVEDELGHVVFEELHRIAGGALGRGARALEPTALVNEAWLRFRSGSTRFEHRRQFFALAARVMRSVLVDHARARRARKREGGGERVTVSEASGLSSGGAVDFLDLEDALQRLRVLDEALHRLVELRFFAGLAHPEIADLLGISLSSVERRWRLARAWLRGELDR